MNRQQRKANNIGSFRPYPFDSAVAQTLIDLEKSGRLPEMILTFDRYHSQLSDYGFWYFLSTCWVRYSGHSDLNIWIKHFGSDRPNRDRCIMKPTELKFYRGLPKRIICYRAHRPGEEKWIAYTIDPERAKMFAKKRGVDEIVQYAVPKDHVIAYFSRRSESEIIVLDPKVAEKIQVIPVVG